jgi:hypothetical protein
MRLTRSYGKSAASDFYLFLPWHHINTATPIHLLHHHHRFYTNPLKIFFHGINKKQSVLVDSHSDGNGFVWFQHTWLSRLLFSQTLWRNGGSVTVINGGRNRQTNIL